MLVLRVNLEWKAVLADDPTFQIHPHCSSFFWRLSFFAISSCYVTTPLMDVLSSLAGRLSRSSKGAEERRDDQGGLEARSFGELLPPVALRPVSRLSADHDRPPRLGYSAASHIFPSPNYINLATALSPHRPFAMDALAVENARLRAELARVEEERDSLARIAATAIHALQRASGHAPSLWVREDDHSRLHELVQSRKDERLSTHEDRWKMATVSSTASIHCSSLPSPCLTLHL